MTIEIRFATNPTTGFQFYLILLIFNNNELHEWHHSRVNSKADSDLMVDLPAFKHNLGYL